MPVIGPKPSPIPSPVKPVIGEFLPPRCDLSIPDNLGRRPTMADVTV